MQSNNHNNHNDDRPVEKNRASVDQPDKEEQQQPGENNLDEVYHLLIEINKQK
jgi:hypothetical protein